MWGGGGSGGRGRVAELQSRFAFVVWQGWLCICRGGCAFVEVAGVVVVGRGGARAGQSETERKLWGSGHMHPGAKESRTLARGCTRRCATGGRRRTALEFAAQHPKARRTTGNCALLPAPRTAARRTDLDGRRQAAAEALRGRRQQRRPLVGAQHRAQPRGHPQRAPHEQRVGAGPRVLRPAGTEGCGCEVGCASGGRVVCVRQRWGARNFSCAPHHHHRTHTQKRVASLPAGPTAASPAAQKKLPPPHPPPAPAPHPPPPLNTHTQAPRGPSLTCRSLCSTSSTSACTRPRSTAPCAPPSSCSASSSPAAPHPPSASSAASRSFHHEG